MNRTGKMICRNALAVVILTLLFLPLRVQAAPRQMPDGTIFDAEFYAGQYPDVVAVLGTDPDLLYQHYLTCGKAEGRLPYAPNQGPDFAQARIKVFSAPVIAGTVYENGVIAEYRSGYCKVEYPGGDTVIKGRFSASTQEAVLFDAKRYAAENPDIAARVGSNPQALWEHYKNYGVYEGRPAYAVTENGNAKLAMIGIVEQITNVSMTDREKVKAVHDWIITTTTFGELSGRADQFMTAVLYHRRAVCAGYADAFSYAMSVLGIPCDLVTGYGQGGDHAWNRVYIEGEWKYIDVTWDDPVLYYNGVRRETLDYDYFLISAEEMEKDHTTIKLYRYYQ